MRRSGVIAVVAGVLAVAVLAPLAPQVSAASPVVTTAKAVTFQSAMRKLWEDHVTWTRLYLVSAIAGLPDTQPTAKRLLQNQADIGDAVKPFYGEAAGATLTALLRDHILIAADLVAAAKAADNVKVTAARSRWYANADEIAGFLASANRYWPQGEMRAMMREHLDLTLGEATARLKGDWALDIATYDKIHDQILKMADMLSAGIIAQFPKTFR